MPAIYTPQGKAGEYADLAINIYAGCPHGCRYCYVPAIVRRKREDFHAGGIPRKGILENVFREAGAYAFDPRAIFLSFTSDPYQPAEQEYRVTRAVLKILAENNCRATVLTKDPDFAVKRDLDVFRSFGPGRFSLGTTLVFAPGETEAASEDEKEWEPTAPTSVSRLNGLRAAKMAGITTWVSLEPVIYPEQTLGLIRLGIRAGIVDHWKVGKLNHDPEHEMKINWSMFAQHAIHLLEAAGASYYLKESLRPFAPKGWKPRGE